MKKLTFLCIVLLFFGYLKSQFTIDIIGGLALTDFKEKTTGYPSNLESYSSSFGYTIGINFKKNLSNKFYLNSRINFFNRSVTYNDESLLHLQYIEVPLNIAFNIKNKYFIGVGPQMGYLMNHFIKKSGEKFNTILVPEKDFDMGINLDLSAQLSSRFLVGLNLYSGLYKIDKINLTNLSGEVIGEYSLKNLSGTIYLGYKLF